ncbi:MAG: hypothetical protein H3Z54_11865 [archaeon]|nr:hypothetical protein [archaeon]MCP8316544.1 hypothetical protein [archaeon]
MRVSQTEEKRQKTERLKRKLSSIRYLKITEEKVLCELCKRNIIRLEEIHIGGGLYLCRECYDDWR